MSESERLLGGRYQVGEVIGRGGMAEVHRGTDLRLGRSVAIKILRQDLARDPAFINRFRREAHAAAALNHPNIVAIYDTGEDEVQVGITTVTVPWIVMEYVDGITLRQVLQSGHKIEPARALDIANGILAALDYSHRHGIIHRDIKPGNVMLTKQGAVKVMDFGIARAIADASATMTQTNTVMGTAQYLSPEQARGESVDARSDLYSTGCVVYELLTGKPPFVGDSPMAIAYQHVTAEAPVPSAANSEVPTSFDAVIDRALAKAPAARYQSAADFRADIERLSRGEQPTQALGIRTAPTSGNLGNADATTKLETVSSTSVATSSPRNRNTGLILGAIAVLALVLGAFFLIAKLISPAPVAQVTVPDLGGLSIDAAQQKLKDAGLTIGNVGYEISQDRPANTVISQNPIADSEADKGSAVDIVVSRGKEQVPVPTLVNFASPDDARAALTAVGLTLGRVDFEDSELPINTVLRSDPAAGTYVDKGTAIAIVISTGKVQVPNVVNQTETNAKNTLYNLQFVVNIEYVSDDTVAAGTVIGQNPAGGTSAAVGSTITLQVSKLPTDQSPAAP